MISFRFCFLCTCKRGTRKGKFSCIDETMCLLFVYGVFASFDDCWNHWPLSFTLQHASTRSKNKALLLLLSFLFYIFESIPLMGTNETAQRIIRVLLNTFVFPAYTLKDSLPREREREKRKYLLFFVFLSFSLPTTLSLSLSLSHVARALTRIHAYTRTRAHTYIQAHAYTDTYAHIQHTVNVSTEHKRCCALPRLVIAGFVGVVRYTNYRKLNECSNRCFIDNKRLPAFLQTTCSSVLFPFDRH